MIDLGATHYILHFREDGSPPIVEQRTLMRRSIVGARWEGRCYVGVQGWVSAPDLLKFHHFSSWEEYDIFEKDIASTFVSSS